MAGFWFIVTLAISIWLLNTCADGAARVGEVKRAEARMAEIEAEYARTPYIVPSPSEKPIDAKAIDRAARISESNHCGALGKALRSNDQEFTRAMIQRTADLHLGVLHMEDQNTIKKRSISLGMTPCMAVAAWGRPDRINRSVGSYGVHEQWVYPANYLYFEDGILRSFQD